MKCKDYLKTIFHVSIWKYLEILFQPFARLTLVLLPAGRQILIFILRIGAIHVRRFLLGIVLQNRIVLLILWLSPFHRHRVQFAVQTTFHMRHTTHFCGLVVRFLAITEAQSQEKLRIKKGRFNLEVWSRHRDDVYRISSGNIQNLGVI